MRIAAFILTLLIVGCQPNRHAVVPRWSMNGDANSSSEYLGHGLAKLALADPIPLGNMTVVPLVPREQGTDEAEKSQDYLSLAQAKAKGWIEIRELPEGERVNQLEVVNTGPQPILLLVGELLVGGLQDRVVAKDTVIPPKKTVLVPVFCVEHGRWDGVSKHFEGGNLAVPLSVRAEAAYGDQGSVWDRVENYNRRLGASPATSSVRGGLQAAKVTERVESDLQKFLAALDRHPRAVGIICVINGAIQSAEVFGSPKLFQACRASLLKVFLTEAAAAESDQVHRFSISDCRRFLDRAQTARRHQTEFGVAASAWAVESDGLVGSETLAPGSKAGPATPELGLIHGTYSESRD